MVDVVILLSAVLIVIVFAFTAETEIRWVGHALAGIISLLFSIAAAVVGAMLVGRMRRAQGVNLFGLHKKITIYLVALIVGAFFFGLVSLTENPCSGSTLSLWQQSFMAGLVWSL